MNRRPVPGRLAGVACAVVLAVLAPAAPATAAGRPVAAVVQVATTTTVGGPSSVTVGEVITVGATVLRADGTPAAGVPVEFSVSFRDAVAPLGPPVPTGPDGTVSATFTPDAVGPATFLVTAQPTAGPAPTAGSTARATVTVVPVVAVLTAATAQQSVESEASTLLTVTLARPDAGPVAGQTLTIWARQAGPSGTVPAAAPWRVLRTGRTISAGRLVVPVSPWRTTQYRVKFLGDDRYAPVTSTPLTVTARPTGRVVVPPRRAPEPAVPLPDRPRAVRAGANATISPVPPAVFARMRGVSWTPGCRPVSTLRYVQVNYWGFDGLRYRGELVVNADVAARVAAAFTQLYANRYPIRQMIEPSAFVRSRYKGADDYRSMAADNTYAFNCRYVVGRETARILSPHATGRAIDINPWENPYSGVAGVVPNRYYVSRAITHPAVLRSTRDANVRAFTRQGFSWGGLWSSPDTQHFQR